MLLESHQLFILTIVFYSKLKIIWLLLLVLYLIMQFSLCPFILSAKQLSNTGLSTRCCGRLTFLNVNSSPSVRLQDLLWQWKLFTKNSSKHQNDATYAWTCFLFTQILWFTSVMSNLVLLSTIKCIFLHLNLYLRMVSIILVTIQTMPGY